MNTLCIICGENKSGGASGKELPANAGNITDEGSIPGSGRYPGEGNGYLLQSAYLEKE